MARLILTREKWAFVKTGKMQRSSAVTSHSRDHLHVRCLRQCSVVPVQFDRLLYEKTRTKIALEKRFARRRG